MHKKYRYLNFCSETEKEPGRWLIMGQFTRALALDSSATRSVAEQEKERSKAVLIKLIAEIYTMTYINASKYEKVHEKKI